MFFPTFFSLLLLLLLLSYSSSHLLFSLLPPFFFHFHSLSPLPSRLFLSRPSPIPHLLPAPVLYPSDPSFPSPSSSVPPGESCLRSHSVSYQQHLRVSQWGETHSVQISGRRPLLPPPHHHSGNKLILTQNYTQIHSLRSQSFRRHQTCLVEFGEVSNFIQKTSRIFPCDGMVLCLLVSVRYQGFQISMFGVC